VNFVESHALPIVDVAVEFAAGSAYDSREQAGLAQLTLAMLRRARPVIRRPRRAAVSPTQARNCRRISTWIARVSR